MQLPERAKVKIHWTVSPYDFSDEKMEAIAHLPSADVAEGLVSNEVKRGWMLKDRVLRAAQVVVSAGAPAAEEKKPEAENG